VRPVLADAAEVARRALVELEPDGVGVHLGVSAEDETAATHRFEATLPGYRGWQWAVVVAAPPEATYATVSESALLPGPDALIAPDFVPWEQRVRPGDLGPGDLLAPPADDPRLVPGYIATGDPVVDEVCHEVGLGRTQVLSLEGRIEAAERWYTEFGPDTEMAKAAPSTCGLCGFFLPLAGALRESFGVCGNAMGADGHVVHIEYGCGAHSDVVAPSGNGSPRYEAFDDHAVELVEIVRANGTAAAEASAAAVTEQQETAEAEAADAAAATRAALAEGARPESADEVVAAEPAPVAEPASAAGTVAEPAQAADAAATAPRALAEGARQESAPDAETASVVEPATEAPSSAEDVDTVAELPVADPEVTAESSAAAVADTAAVEPTTGDQRASAAADQAAVADQAAADQGAAAESAARDAAEDTASVAAAESEVAESVSQADTDAAADGARADAAEEAAVAGAAVASPSASETASDAAGAEVVDAAQGDSADEHGSSVAR